jgi:hypothetical protein
MNDVWEEVWGIVSETFRRTAARLTARYPEMSWSSGHSENKAFPFRAYASFNQGSPGAEDVVVSVDFHRSDHKLGYSADIGNDDGTVLADGPAGIIDISQGIDSARADIKVAIVNIVRFLEDNEPVLSDAIGN